MDEQDKKLVSRARDIAFLKSYEGWADIYAVSYTHLTLPTKLEV